MDTSVLLGKKLDDAIELLKEINTENFSVDAKRILSPREDIIGSEERVIKVEIKDKIIIYYSLF